jgi:hypothetical protein
LPHCKEQVICEQVRPPFTRGLLIFTLFKFKRRVRLAPPWRSRCFLGVQGRFFVLRAWTFVSVPVILVDAGKIAFPAFTALDAEDGRVCAADSAASWYFI